MDLDASEQSVLTLFVMLSVVASVTLQINRNGLVRSHGYLQQIRSIRGICRQAGLVHNVLLQHAHLDVIFVELEIQLIRRDFGRECSERTTRRCLLVHPTACSIHRTYGAFVIDGDVRETVVDETTVGRRVMMRGRETSVATEQHASEGSADESLSPHRFDLLFERTGDLISAQADANQGVHMRIEAFGNERLLGVEDEFFQTASTRKVFVERRFKSIAGNSFQVGAILATDTHMDRLSLALRTRLSF